MAQKKKNTGDARFIASNAPLPDGVLFVEKSANSKLSRKKRVSVTMVAMDSCPGDCPFYPKVDRVQQTENTCYSMFGKQGFQTKRLHAGGPKNPTVLAQREADALRAASGKYPLRLHVVGDAKTRTGVDMIAEACEEYREKHGQPVWTYTHVHHIERAAWRGVSVLRSCHTFGQIERAHRDGYAATLVVDRFPSGSRAWKEDGFTFIPCPNQTQKRTCDECRLCWNGDRLHAARAVIAFELHGVNGLHEADRAERLPDYDAVEDLSA